MSRQRLPKKLQPAKKAWRSLSNTLQSKFHNLKFNKSNVPKAIKTTLQRLLSTFHSLRRLIPTKPRRSLVTRPYNPSSYYFSKNFSAIRIDDLFAEPPAASASASQGETSRAGENLNTIEDAWKMVVAKSPQLQVDQKAEEFIQKFREDMKLQKERSMLEFQERLARSS